MSVEKGQRKVPDFLIFNFINNSNSNKKILITFYLLKILKQIY